MTFQDPVKHLFILKIDINIDIDIVWQGIKICGLGIESVGVLG